MAGGGSDHMQKIGRRRGINPYDPFLGMSIMLVRQPRWTDQPLHPEQCLTREEALRLYTIRNAALTFEEKEKGSLEPGKLADFIVLDRDFLTCPVEGSGGHPASCRPISAARRCSIAARRNACRPGPSMIAVRTCRRSRNWTWAGHRSLKPRNR